MSSVDIVPGVLVAEKYLIEKELGRGGMGVVLAARHSALGVRVALKILTVSTEASGAVARFLREARATASLRSEHVARVSDFGTLPDGRPFMVLEYLEGEDLDAVLARGLPREDVVDAVCQACAGLAEAHAAGIVHRDLKPSNLFRTRRPDGSACIKVLDFGISKLLRPTPDAQLVSTDTSAVLGTPLYMAPEQVRSTRDADARSDVWSLGVVLAEALSGVPPFTGQTLGEVFSRILEAPPHFPTTGRDVPGELHRIVLKCLAKRPDERFASVAELATALAPFASHEGREASRRARDTAAVAPSAARASDSGALPVHHAAAMAETLDASAADTAADPIRARTAPIGSTIEPRDTATPSRRWIFIAAAVAASLAVTFVVASRGPSPTPAAGIVIDSAGVGSPSTTSAPSGSPLVVAPSAPSPATSSSPTADGSTAKPRGNGSAVTPARMPAPVASAKAAGAGTTSPATPLPAPTPAKSTRPTLD